VVVDSYFLGHPNSDNVYNRSSRTAIESLETLNGIEINRYVAGFEGRAAELLIKHVEPNEEIPTGSCQLPSWIGGNLKNPEGIEIDFEGNVTLCPGICIGNTRTQSLAQILHNYDYFEHPILSLLAQGGPVALLQSAMAKGFKPQKFVDECNLCYEVRKFLKPSYPQYLAPATCY